MAKLGIFASILTIAAVIGMVTVADAADACKHAEFKTELVRDACKNGQASAKDAMKKFMKDAKIKSCNQCHTSLAPKYDLKKDAYDQFQKAGGKLIDDKGDAK
jgi:hypothetical protein